MIKKTSILIGTNVIEPVNLELSVPPKVNSPFVTVSAVAGSKETETS